MNLIQRYLQAVRFWLPKEQQDDILAELSEDIRSQIEEQEAGLGRALGETDLAALLKRRGRPIAVASSYLPQRTLIGPLLFPVYLFTLKIVCVCYLVPWVLLPLMLTLFSSSYRGERSALELMGGLWSSIWVTALALFAAVTLVFAAIERAQSRSALVEDWDPCKLPNVRTSQERRRIPRSSSLVEIVIECLFAAWWVDASPAGSAELGWRWTQGPVWLEFHERFYVAILLLSLVWVAMACANLVRSEWSRLRLGLRCAVNAAVAGMLLVTLIPHADRVRTQWLALRTATGGAASAELEATASSLVAYAVLGIAALVCVSCFLYELIRILRWNASRAWSPVSTRPVEQ